MKIWQAPEDGTHVMERLRAMEMSLKSLETSLSSSVEGMTAKLDELLSFGHTRVPSRADEPHEVDQVRKLDNIDRKINMIAEAVGVPAADVVNRYVFPVAWVR